MENKLFITDMLSGNEKLCKMVLRVTEDPRKLKDLSRLCEYFYNLGVTEGIDRLLP